MARKLRDIGEHIGPPDMPYLQRKISSAGEMKSEIKKICDGCDACSKRQCPLHRKLRKSMEAYLNA